MLGFGGAGGGFDSRLSTRDSRGEGGENMPKSGESEGKLAKMSKNGSKMGKTGKQGRKMSPDGQNGWDFDVFCQVLGAVWRWGVG